MEKEQTLPTRAIIYCRVSSKKQVREGNGLQTQESRCRRWCDQNNLEIVQTFREKGISGEKESRPEFDNMLKFAMTTKERFIILFDNTGRHARNTELFISSRRKLEERGHRLASVNKGLLGLRPGDRYNAIVDAAQAERERLENAERTRDYMKDHADQGYWVMNPPTGYKRKRIDLRLYLVRLEPTATILQEAIEGFANGRFPTQKAVYDFLRNQPILNFVEKPVQITMNFVKNLLTNEKYTGIFPYKRWNIPRQKWQIEPIISQEIYQAVQDRLKGKKTIKPKKYNMNDQNFPLRRWVRCSVCGEHLTASRPRGKAGNRFEYYHCHKKGCPLCGKSIRKADIHNDFESVLQEITPDGRLCALAREIIHECYNEQTADFRDNVTKKRALLADKIADKARAFDILMHRDTAPEVAKICNERISVLAAEIKILESELHNAPDEPVPLGEATDYVMDFITNALGIWRDGDYYERQGVLNLCFEEQPTYDKVEKFGTPKLSEIYGIFNEDLGNIEEWRTQKDSNSQSSDP